MGEVNTAYKPTEGMQNAFASQDQIAEKIKATPTPEPEVAPAETPESSPQAAIAQPEVSPEEEIAPVPLTPEQEQQKVRSEAGQLTAKWMDNEASRIAKMKEKKRSQGEIAILTVSGFKNIAEGKSSGKFPITLTGENNVGNPIQFRKFPDPNNPGQFTYSYSKSGTTIETIVKFESGVFVCTTAEGRETRIPAVDFIGLSIQSETASIIAHASNTKRGGSESMGAVVAATIAPETRAGTPPLTHDTVEVAARTVKLISADTVQIMLANSGVSESVVRNIEALVGKSGFVDIKTTAQILYQLDFHNNELRSIDQYIETITLAAKKSGNPQEIMQANTYIEQLKVQRSAIAEQLQKFGKNEAQTLAFLEGSLQNMDSSEFNSFVGALTDEDQKKAFAALLKNIPVDKREKFAQILDGTAKYGSIAALALVVLLFLQSTGGK